MKIYDVTEGTGILKVYIENIRDNRVLVSIQQKEWSYLLRYDIGTQYEFESEHKEMLRSLCRRGLQYNHAKELCDLIEKWIHDKKTLYDNIVKW